MTLAIYIDENVRRAIADELLMRGVDALNVREDGRTGISDPEVLEES
jgi:predicted nuclease of predicted toxin-antitoxin system